ncbi:LETM1-related biofilm-associated protein [Mariniflexile ostreae]|uniref:LETM1-related biofilm-associated protein n=1 Tax=Mariniflexile ostreae TaxID=1520892 RepID=A0ABV5FCV5_9FLAO
MNPSANGWIKKLLVELKKNHTFLNLDVEAFYNALRTSGFIYGSNAVPVADAVKKLDLTEEEICKVNLCVALLYMHSYAETKTPFIDSAIAFYSEISAIKTSFFHGFMGVKKSNELLESIIHKRIQIDPNVLTKNFSYFITNALLFVDVLAYQQFLKHQTISDVYIKTLEASILSISLRVLNSKTDKNKYDMSLIKLFESSVRFNDHEDLTFNNAIKHINTNQEKYYILDLACMATWSDRIIDPNEQSFLTKLCNDLNLEPFRVQQSIITINTFYATYKDSIALLSSKNMVKTFYNNSSKMVMKLISRNSKRLYQELLDSKELMVLLTHSTVRDLTPEESKKVQEQLLDIFKSIPSLAIFMLPGGALLLPLVIKFIPKLLPSAFDDNRIDD